MFGFNDVNCFSGLLYKNSIDCLRQTVSKEGFFALYKGKDVLNLNI